MNKKDLIEHVAKEVDLSKKDANDAIDAMISAITKSLKKKKKVTLVGFGTFSTKKRKARKGINPATQKPIKIKARTVPHFKAGSKLKEAVK